eukprot:5064174-Pleurochrysis_carterae.AAC.1
MGVSSTHGLPQPLSLSSDHALAARSRTPQMCLAQNEFAQVQSLRKENDSPRCRPTDLVNRQVRAERAP